MSSEKQKLRFSLPCSCCSEKVVPRRYDEENVIFMCNNIECFHPLESEKIKMYICKLSEVKQKWNELREIYKKEKNSFMIWNLNQQSPHSTESSA